MNKRKISIRELEALVGEHVMHLRIVSHDWPYDYDPECGGTEARILFLRGATPQTVECGERGPVYTNNCEGQEWYRKVRDDDTFMADVKMVPEYARDANATREVISKLRNESYRLRRKTPDFSPGI